MARKSLRTGSRRKVKIRTASGLKTHYRKRKINAPKCAMCKKKLAGIKPMIASRFRNITSSQRKVARKYGGNLCSACSRALIVEKARAMKLKP